MNLRKWTREQRHRIGDCTTAIYGAVERPEPGDPPWRRGTGTFLCFRGVPVVLTCRHVLERLQPLVLTTGWDTRYQHGAVRTRLFEPAIDVGIIVLSSGFDWGRKRPIEARDAVLDDVDPGEPVAVYGFPAGSRDIQQGFRWGVDGAVFTSTTYFSVTGQPHYNAALRGQRFPTIDWSAATLRRADDFSWIPEAKGMQFDRRGFSGGPVFLSQERRLIGHVTHVRDEKDGYFYYIPIRRSFEFLDRELNTVVDLDRS